MNKLKNFLFWVRFITVIFLVITTLLITVATVQRLWFGYVYSDVCSEAMKDINRGNYE